MMNNWFISVNPSQFGELKVWFAPTPPNLRLQSTVIEGLIGPNRLTRTRTGIEAETKKIYGTVTIFGPVRGPDPIQVPHGMLTKT